MSVSWVGSAKDWAATDTPDAATLNVEVLNRLDYLKARKLEFFAGTDEGKHLEFGEQSVTVVTGQPAGSASITFNTAFASVVPTPKVTAESVDSGAYFAFVTTLSSTAMTVFARHYNDTNAGADKTVPINYLVVG